MLTYERLVGEYERVSPQKYPDDLKISTLLSGLPTDVRRYLQLQISDSTKYEQLRDIMLTFERSSSSWCSEQVLKAIGADSGGPMDVDRVKGKGKKGTKGKSEGKGKAKGFDKGKGKGDHSFKGKSDGKGKKGSGKGKGKSESGKGAKGQKTCWICHKPGHVAADCWRRQQVQEDETSSTVTRSTTAPSTSTTTSAPSSSEKSQVRRVLVYDLTDIGEETGDATEAWPSDQVRRLEEVECEGEECELPSSSCLWFRIDQDDEEEYCRAVRGSSASPPYENQPVEVILDSGADCTVLPAEIYGGVGSLSLQGNMSVLLDAQGNRIAGGEERVQVCFQIRDEDGAIIEFKDNVVLAHVQQPLFCLGKLMKRQWKPECDEFGRWTMRRGEACFPLHWSRNSLATYMTISRVTDESPEDPSPPAGPSPPDAMRVQMIIEIPDELECHSHEPGWSMDAFGRLVHLGLNMDRTCNASLRFSPRDWPHRSTLLWREGKKYEIFECGELWSGDIQMEFEEGSQKVITVLSKSTLRPEDLGTPVSGDLPPRAELHAESGVGELRDAGDGDAVGGESMDVDQGDGSVQPRPEGPMLGPHAVEVEGPEQEAIVVNDVRLTETSTLRELRAGCRWMGISKNGSKAAVWSRLKREVALAKLKVSVEASEAVKAEYAREPLVPSLAERPSEDLVLLHETNIPKAAWCEACLASRSREDNYDDAMPTREYPLLSIDYMFTATEGREQPLATHLIVVDSQSKYTQAIAIDGKGGRSLKHCVEEITRLASVLGYTRIGLRYDTEPAMKQLASYVVATRLKMGLATEEEPVAPDPGSHGASRAERYIGTVRSLGNCLLQTVQQHTGHKTESKDPLFAWAYRHAAFLHTRFKVQKDGCSAFELVHGRKYKSKLMPFGSFVYAQFLPRSKSKGESWKPCVWLGRSTLGDLNLVGDAQGIHQARSVRLSPKRFDVEALKTMKGVPWDHTLEALPLRRCRIQ